MHGCKSSDAVDSAVMQLHYYWRCCVAQALENRTLDSKREMDIMNALDEMKSLKARQERVDGAALLSALSAAPTRTASRWTTMTRPRYSPAACCALACVQGTQASALHACWLRKS